MEAMLAQRFSFDCPAVGGSRTRRWQRLQQEGGALSNLENAQGSCLTTKAHALSTTLPSLPLKLDANRGDFRPFDAEIGRPLWAGVHFKSYPIRDHLSPHTGRSS